MLRRLVSLPKRMTAEALATPLGRGGFLREIRIALLSSLSWPFILLLFIWAGVRNTNAAFFTFYLVFAITGLLGTYAFSRLNAATLARERAVFGASQPIHPPWQGPILLRCFWVQGSTTSQFLALFPFHLGLALTATLLLLGTRDYNLLLFLLPLLLILFLQFKVAAKLLR